MPSFYQQLIMETLGCDEAHAQAIEEIMRQDIFHSTLDWQTREQLEEAAREAELILQSLGE